MKRNRPPSRETRKVLELLAGGGWLHGYDMLKATGLKSGSLYPILMRLEERGMVEAEWQEPVKPGRPARHAYRLTPAGRLFRAGLVACDVIGPAGSSAVPDIVAATGAPA